MVKVTGFCCLAALAVSAAGAHPGATAPTRTISSKGLDLTRADHLQQLRKRVSAAAYDLCEIDETGRYTERATLPRRRCHGSVMARTEPQLASLIERTRQARTGGAATAVLAATTIVIAR